MAANLRRRFLCRNKKLKMDDIKVEEMQEQNRADYDPLYYDGEDDVNQIPLMEGEASDADSELIIETNESEDSDDETENEAAMSSPATRSGYYVSKNGTKWSKKPPKSGRTRAHTVVDYGKRKPGPVIKTHDPLTIFKSIFTEEIANIILRETNSILQKGVESWNNSHPADKKPYNAFTRDELNAFLAIILHAGVCQSNNEPAPNFWEPTRAPIYKAAMSYKRFIQMQKLLRFDNGSTRAERWKTSKTAPIDEIWMKMQDNLEAAYIPHDSLTVVDQLSLFTKRLQFTQYIPTKPEIHGIRIYWLCDSKSSFPLRGSICTGKLARETQVDHAQRIVQDIAKKYLYTGRTIYADKYFSSLDMATTLLNKKTAYVGTVNAKAPYVPREFVSHPQRSENSSVFGFYKDDVALCSYVPSPKKSIIVMSTMHYTCDTDAEDMQPMALHDYDSHTFGDDAMDYTLVKYTCKRSTPRWTLALFYNMIDVAALASFIIYDEQDPVKKADKRRAFLHLLIYQLAIGNIEHRALDSKITSCRHVKNAMAAFDVIVTDVPLVTGASPAPSNKTTCYMCKQFNNRTRKTRACCCSCQNPVCIEHSEHFSKCNLCKAAPTTGTTVKLEIP